MGAVPIYAHAEVGPISLTEVQWGCDSEMAKALSEGVTDAI